MKLANTKSKIGSIEDKVQEYYTLREQSKTIKSRMDVLAKEIKSYAESKGTKNDTGSFYCENEHFLFGKQAKKSVSFVKDKAIDFLKKHGFKSAIKTVEIIDEDEVEKLISTGDISFDDLQSITETKTSYAIDLKKKEDMPEVEETSVSMAASRKPKLFPKGGKK